MSQECSRASSTLATQWVQVLEANTKDVGNFEIVNSQVTGHLVTWSSAFVDSKQFFFFDKFVIWESLAVLVTTKLGRKERVL